GVGGGLGAMVAWLLLRPGSAVLNTRLSMLQQELGGARAEAAKFTHTNAQLKSGMDKLEATVTAERRANEEKAALLSRLEEKLRETFQAISAEALKSNNQAFLQLANATMEKFQSEAEGDLEQRRQAVEHLVAPIGESLKKVDAQIQQIEAARNQAYGDLTAQVRSLAVTQEKL